MEKVKRRVRVVDGQLQYRVIAIFLSLVLAGLVVAAAASALYVLAAARAGGGGRPELLLAILPPLLVNDLAIMVLVIVVGIPTTHRIAGPIYRMEADIERALAGERDVRVRLRSGDAFPDLAGKVNELLERIDAARKG
jgi:hypothetical protein